MTKQERAELLQNLLLNMATDGDADGSEYQQLRQEMLRDQRTRELLPRFVVTSRDLGQFWSFIKYKFSTYQERREYIWEQFRPLIDSLEGVRTASAPPDADIDSALAQYDAEHVFVAWQKALARRFDDPDGAITSARTLLESVCKHILDEAGVVYNDKMDLPKLYHLTAEQLNMAPSQHEEKIFKQILGGCKSVVEGLGALRNKLSDAHGKGKQGVKPAERHAALAVNLAGSMAAFFVSSWKERQAGAE
ncbi:MAG TPA: abortive phage resistance protein [Bacteroidetes bacterium]|nr:abortive phage resistance protein [Bacteroidota bacterium]